MTNNKTGTEGLHSAGSCSIPKFWGPNPWVSMVLRHMKCWGPGFLRSHVTWNVDVLGFQGLTAYANVEVLGFQGLATYANVEVLGFQGLAAYGCFKVLGFQGLAAYGCFKVLGFQGLATKMTMQGPGSIKVPDLGLCEPWISDLFGTLAHVWFQVAPLYGSRMISWPKENQKVDHIVQCHWTLGQVSLVNS